MRRNADALAHVRRDALICYHSPPPSRSPSHPGGASPTYSRTSTRRPHAGHSAECGCVTAAARAAGSAACAWVRQRTTTGCHPRHSRHLAGVRRSIVASRVRNRIVFPLSDAIPIYAHDQFHTRPRLAPTAGATVGIGPPRPPPVALRFVRIRHADKRGRSPPLAHPAPLRLPPFQRVKPGRQSRPHPRPPHCPRGLSQS